MRRPGLIEGSPLEEPAQLVSRNGLLRAELVVERRRVNLGGHELWALTCNGRCMPPTLRHILNHEDAGMMAVLDIGK
ncbi:hypothetical protein ACWCRF_20290 [Streptomyces sp. NPDC002405]|uniref:hypothetical protein n=1 Tax=unclassified Streptomyces TaxID=2593676 RepID=UPI00368AAE7A